MGIDLYLAGGGNKGNTPGLSPAQWAVLAAQGVAGLAGAWGAPGRPGPMGPAGARGRLPQGLR